MPDSGAVAFWQPEDDDHRYVEDVLPAAGRLTRGRRTPEEAAAEAAAGGIVGGAFGAAAWPARGVARSFAAAADATGRLQRAARPAGRQRISWADPMTMDDVFANGHALGADSALGALLDIAYDATSPTFGSGRRRAALGRTTPEAAAYLPPQTAAGGPGAGYAPNANGGRGSRGGFGPRPATATAYYDDGGEADYGPASYAGDGGTKDGSVIGATDAAGNTATAGAGSPAATTQQANAAGALKGGLGAGMAGGLPRSSLGRLGHGMAQRDRPSAFAATPAFARIANTQAVHAAMAPQPASVIKPIPVVKPPLAVDDDEPAYLAPTKGGLTGTVVDPTLRGTAGSRGDRIAQPSPKEPTDIETTAALIAKRNAEKRAKTIEDTAALAALPLTDDLPPEQWIP